MVVLLWLFVCATRGDVGHVEGYRDVAFVLGVFGLAGLRTAKG